MSSRADKHYCAMTGLNQALIKNNVCVFQVRDGRTGSVLFQSEEKSSRIRCTCMCRQASAVVLGQEDGTVQVETLSTPTVHVCMCKTAVRMSLVKVPNMDTPATNLLPL